MTRPRRPSLAILVPAVLVMMVFPHSLTLKMDGARSLYHSFLEKGSTAFFLPPFLDLVRRLFFPCYYSKARDDRIKLGSDDDEYDLLTLASFHPREAKYNAVDSDEMGQRLSSSISLPPTPNSKPTRCNTNTNQLSTEIERYIRVSAMSST